jgi:WD40 repeat protein
MYGGRLRAPGFDTMTPAAGTPLQQRWSTPVPDDGPRSLVATSDTVIVGTRQGSETDVLGSLMALDANTGTVIRQVVNYWMINALAVSPDNRWLASAEHPQEESGEVQPGDTDRIRILDITTGQERSRWIPPPDTTIRAVAFSPDSKWVAVTYTEIPAGDIALVFRASDGTVGGSVSLPRAIRGLAWCPYSDVFAVGCHDGVAIVDTQGTRQATFSCPDAAAVAYSSDGSRIAAAGQDGIVRVFNTATGQLVWQTALTSSPVVSVAISDDQGWVAALSLDQKLGVYDLAHGSIRYPAVPCTAGQVEFSPTLRHLLVTDQFGSTTQVIDVPTGQLAHSCPGAAARLIPPDGTALIAAGDGIERYDLGVLVAPPYAVGAPLSSIALSPGATTLIAVADTSAGVTVIAAESGVRLINKPVPGIINCLTFADDGQSVITGASTGARMFSVLGSNVWALDTLGDVKAVVPVGATGSAIAAAAGKNVFLLASADGSSRWPATAAVPAPGAHPQLVTRLAASADGKWVATGCADRITRILDAATGAVIFSSPAGDGRVTAVAFAPTTTVLASANEDGSVLLVDAANPTHSGNLTRPVPCRLIAVSGDSTLLAVADDTNTVTVYDITTITNPTLQQQISFTAPITALAFGPADSGLAIAIGATNVTLYEPRTGNELQRVLHPQPVRQFAFGADGPLLATICDDQAARTWRTGGPVN